MMLPVVDDEAPRQRVLTDRLATSTLAAVRRGGATATPRPHSPSRVPRDRRRGGGADPPRASTSTALPCTRGRRAPARASSRHRCSRRWASTPTARCGPAWAGRPPTPTSTRSSTAFPSSWIGCAGCVRKLPTMPTTDWLSPRVRAHRRPAPRRRAPRDHVLRRAAPTASRPFDEPMPEPLADGRTGRVPAGCVFWMKAAERTFSTVAEDHGNCSVGSMTHGFKTLEEVAGNSDVAALLETRAGSRWTSSRRSRSCTRSRARSPTARWPTRRSTPTSCSCASPAASSWCCPTRSRACASKASRSATSWRSPRKRACPRPASVARCSRVRTGMPPTEMTCAIPASQLAEIVAVDRSSNAGADNAVAQYAAEDATRFAPLIA